MSQSLLLSPEPSPTVETVPSPSLLVHWESGFITFFRNLFDTLFGRLVPEVVISSRPGPFWSDVFVYSGIPWRSILESMLWHALLISAVWNITLNFVPKTITPQRAAFNSSDVIYYSPNDPFPSQQSRPLRHLPGAKPQSSGKGRSSGEKPLAVAKESREGASPSAPNIRMRASSAPDMGGSNPVVPAVPMSGTMDAHLTLPSDLASAIGPAPGIDQATSRRIGMPQASVVAPAPDPSGASGSGSLRGRGLGNAPGMSAVGPAPSVSGASARFGDINIASSQAVAPSPQLPMHDRRAARGGAGLGAATGTSVVPPPPSVGGSGALRISGGRGGSLVDAPMQAVAPAPSVPLNGASSAGRLGVMRGSGTNVVPPAPTVAGPGGSSIAGRVGSLAGGTRVVPPAPSMNGEGGGGLAAGSRGGGSLSGSAIQVVPPPPSIAGGNGGNSASGNGGSGGGRGGLLAAGNLQAIPPAPSGGGNGAGLSGSRAGALGGTGLQAVPPPPGLDGMTGDGGGRGRGLGGEGLQAVAPAPSGNGVGNSMGNTRGTSLYGGDTQALPPSAAGNGTGNGQGTGLGGDVMAMNTQPQLSPTPPPSEIPDKPGSQELPVRLIAMALALPNSSYFSNYEVFVAERQLGKSESQLIKLVYISLPYQRRLSEYGMDNAKIYKLRVTRDKTCDETVQQITGPKDAAALAKSPGTPLPAALSSVDPNHVLPCYLTTADDYRKAASHAH